MLELHDLAGRRSGPYRAAFNGTDLGATAAPPVIELRRSEVPLAVFAGGTAAFNVIRLAGPPLWLVTLTLTAVPEVLTAIAAAPGTLTLTPTAGTASGSWIFTAARPLPGWEIRLPDRTVHTLTVTFRADSGAAG